MKSSGDRLALKVASKYLEAKANGRTKTAGEVIFKKDNSNDANAWGYNIIGPEKRNSAILHDFNYSPKNMKPLAEVGRSCAAALGHAVSAHNKFTKLKSSKISPDGNLGGKGFIMKVTDIRKQLSNCMEALSAISDTIFDEVNAPHWSVMSRQEDDEDKAQAQELIRDAEKIREDPEEWADEELEEEFGE